MSPPPAFSWNDGVLITSLLYLSIDMQYQWQEFASCQWPVHTWLLVSYIFILAFRLAHVLGTLSTSASSGDFLLNLRHKDSLPQFFMSLTWLMVPMFAMWTGIGTFWLMDSRKLSEKCLPMSMPLVFIVCWQALSYAWILIHMLLAVISWILERRLRRTEASLRSIQDADTVARWGQVSQLPGYTALHGEKLGGLTPDQIHSLPEKLASQANLGAECECSICLNDIEGDDTVRQLSCGHTFHRSCIDLWLLRNAACPLCKQCVNAENDVKDCCHWHV